LEQTNIHVRYSDNMIFTEALVNNAIIEEGYTCPLAERKFNAGLLPKFLDELKSYNMEAFDFIDTDNYFMQYKCTDFWLDLYKSKDEKTVFVTFYCKTTRVSADLFAILKTYVSDASDMEIYCTTYSMNKGIQTSFKVYTEEDYISISELYTPYIDTNSMFEQFYGNKENILILCGPPGTGKTSVTMQLLKYSLNNPTKIPYTKTDDCDGFEYLKMAYVKSTELLAEDSFWSTLSAEEYDLVILDDLDYFLTSRDSEIASQDDVNRNKFINQFLSFTDGIEKNKTKFLITTNQSFTDIDSALMRKGRLFAILELRALTNNEAKNIWTSSGLDAKDFDFTGTVLQSDLGSDIYKRTESKAVTKPYLLDESISKVKKLNKKLGF